MPLAAHVILYCSRFQSRSSCYSRDLAIARAAAIMDSVLTPNLLKIVSSSPDSPKTSRKAQPAEAAGGVLGERLGHGPAQSAQAAVVLHRISRPVSLLARTRLPRPTA